MLTSTSATKDVREHLHQSIPSNPMARPCIYFFTLRCLPGVQDTERIRTLCIRDISFCISLWVGIDLLCSVYRLCKTTTCIYLIVIYFYVYNVSVSVMLSAIFMSLWMKFQVLNLLADTSRCLDIQLHCHVTSICNLKFDTKPRVFPSFKFELFLFVRNIP